MEIVFVTKATSPPTSKFPYSCHIVHDYIFI